MHSLSRRSFLYLGLAASVSESFAADSATVDVHRQILDLATQQEQRRRDRFARVKTQADLTALQGELRRDFLELLDGFPTKTGAPLVKKTGQIEADDYVI